MKAGKNQQVIMRLIDAVSENDRERVLSFFSDESEYQGRNGGSVMGQEAIWNAISAGHRGADEVDWQVDQLNEDDAGKVRYLKNGSWSEYPVISAFEVRGSKVMQWL